jgi:hypothetical protein
MKTRFQSLRVRIQLVALNRGTFGSNPQYMIFTERKTTAVIRVKRLDLVGAAHVDSP